MLVILTLGMCRLEHQKFTLLLFLRDTAFGGQLGLQETVSNEQFKLQ